MRRFLVLYSALLCAAGCSSKASFDKFVPAEAKARQALEAALTSWQNGQAAPARITNTKPPIEVLDSKWRSGQKLASFEIVSHEPNQGGPQWFSVKLILKKPATEQVVRYCVLGNDPLWVYREEDYHKTSGM